MKRLRDDRAVDAVSEKTGKWAWGKSDQREDTSLASVPLWK